MVLYIEAQARLYPWTRTIVSVLDSLGSLCIFGVMVAGATYIRNFIEADVTLFKT